MSVSQDAAPAMIRFSNVNKHYGQYHALVDIDASVSKGEVLVVCGPSGSGKSTLIRTVNRLEEIDSGSITFDGREVSGRVGRADLNRLRSRIGFVFQSFNLFPHLSTLENITLSPIRINGVKKDLARTKAMALLDRVGLAEKANAYPAQLSGGQQQRVAIARALCMDPICMLFDEPTSALDPEMINEVLDVMVELAKEGMTMMCVSHEMGFARKVAHRVIFMDQGRIVEDATKDEFFGTPRSERAQQFLSKILSH